MFVTGVMWRTYEHDGPQLLRLDTAAYETALATFRSAIRSSSSSEAQAESTAVLNAGNPGDNVMDTPELVRGLRELLGTKLVAYLSSVRDTRTVRAGPTPLARERRRTRSSSAYLTPMMWRCSSARRSLHRSSRHGSKATTPYWTTSPQRDGSGRVNSTSQAPACWRLLGPSLPSREGSSAVHRDFGQPACA